MSRGDRSAVLIEALRLPCVVGVHAWERRVRQELLLDLRMTRDFSAAAASDDLADALDYSAVAERLRAHAADTAPYLLERLAVELADLLQREFGVADLELTLRKPGAVTTADAVGVTLRRGA